jgi:hypothetical protein
MATLTNEERVQIIMSAFLDDDDTTTETLTNVRNLTTAITAIMTGNYDATTLASDWTDEDRATFALPPMRNALLNLWTGGRKQISLEGNSLSTAQTDIASLTLGTDEAEPT